MTDDMLERQKAVSAVIRGVAKKTALMAAVVIAAVIVLGMVRGGGEQRWWFLPASILFGGALGLANFRWLSTAVERVYLRPGATPGLSNFAAVIISLLKLSLIFIILFIVIKLRLLHVFGLVGGLSLCFLAIIWEGATLMKQNLMKRDQ